MTLTASLIILTYRQEGYIVPALRSALAQTFEGLEIIVSDDCSPDGTMAAIETILADYRGPHRVVINRTAGNLGLAEHFNQVVAKASGDVVVYLAGDDAAAPNRVEQLVRVLEERTDLTFVESDYIAFTDAESPDIAAAPAGARLETFTLDDFVSGKAPLMSSSTRAFRRELQLKYPPLTRGLASEDTSSALRLLHFGPGAILRAPLLKKRAHEANVTGPEALKKLDFDAIGRQYIADARHAVTLGLRDAATLPAYEAWATRAMERRKQRVLMDLGYPTTTQLAKVLLPSKVLGPRAKLYAVRRWLRGIFTRTA